MIQFVCKLILMQYWRYNKTLCKIKVKYYFHSKYIVFLNIYLTIYKSNESIRDLFLHGEYLTTIIFTGDTKLTDDFHSYCKIFNKTFDSDVIYHFKAYSVFNFFIIFNKIFYITLILIIFVIKFNQTQKFKNVSTSYYFDNIINFVELDHNQINTACKKKFYKYIR